MKLLRLPVIVLQYQYQNQSEAFSCSADYGLVLVKAIDSLDFYLQKFINKHPTQLSEEPNF